MKNFLLIIFFCFSSLAAQTAQSDLCLMTYNLRYASAEGPNNWPSRRPVMVELIQNIQPDILGTQEGLFTQLKDLQQDLTGYQWIGLGREGGSFGEFMAIFYCKRFDVMEYDHFWLSDTPKVIGSTTWGNTNRRMVTWILFLDKTSNRRFYVINTHFDHQIEKARINSAELLVKFLAELDPSMPVFLLGDFNAIAQDSEPYRILVEKTDMQDSWLTADSRTGEGLNTFNGFSAGPHNEGKRIDWILYRGKVRFVKLSIVDFQRQDQYPSDHFPVVGWIKWIE